MLGAATAATTTTAAEEDEAPLFATSTRLDRIGRVVAPVLINGGGPYRLIVDTGANSSALSMALVQKLGLEIDPGNGIQLNSVTGTSIVPAVAIDRLQIGALSLTSLRLPVLLTSVAANVDGILGIDGFANKRLIVDFRADEVTIVEARRPFRQRGHLHIKARMRFGGLMVIDARVGNQSVKAIVDTGAERSVGNLTLLAALRRRSGDNSELPESVVIGATEQQITGGLLQAPPIRMGSVAVRGLQVTFTDLPIFALWGFADEPTLLLGMDVIGTVSELVIDYRRSRIYVLP